MALFENPYPPVVNVEGISTVDVPYRDALDAANPPVDNFQPIQLFAPSTMDLSAFMPSDLRNNEMQTQRPLTIDPRYDAPAPAAAPTSVLGMFPEVEAMQRALYQQKQNEAMQAQAYQFAQLSPMQQAQYSLYMGGQQLGGAIGSALGGKDPQLQMIGLQSRILSELVPGNPAQNIQIAQKYATYAPELAMKIYDNALNQNVKIKQASGAAKQGITANVQQAERIATAEGLYGTAFETRVAELLKGTDKLSDKQATGARVAEITRILSPETGGLLLRSSERAALEAELATYERPDKQLSLTSDRDAISAELNDNKPFAQITPAQKAIVNKRVEAEGRAKARESATVLPGAKGVGDLVGLRKNINETVKPFRDAVNAADQSIELADDVLKTGNFASAASLSRSLAKASGETQLSKQDVAAFGGDPSFVGSISDIASRLGTGTPTKDTTRKLRALAVLLKKKNEALEKNEIKQLQTTARISGLYTEDQIKQVFTLRGESKGKTRTTAGGIPYTVDEEN